ncbi:unnamed protein product, partial [Ectocarpus sp. 8 AP-2014]
PSVCAKQASAKRRTGVVHGCGRLEKSERGSMAREAFVHGEGSPEGGAAAGEGSTGRGYFTPLWRTKGAHSMAGGLLQPSATAALGATGGIPGSNLVESEG